MKILFSLNSFYPPFDIEKPIGGGEISIFELVKYLSQYHDVVVICANDGIKKGEFDFNNYRVINRPIKWYSGLGKWNNYLRNKVWENILIKNFKNERFDLVISQSQFIYSTVKWSKKRNITSYIFLRAYENFPKASKNINSHNKVSKKLIRKFQSLIELPAKIIEDFINRYSIKNADVIVSNSQFMKSQIELEFGVNSQVIFPFVEMPERQNLYENFKEKKRVLFVNPVYRKGVEVFIEIAKSLPNVQFTSVGKIEKKYKKEIDMLNNVEFIEWTININKIYSDTYILLVPSLWNEPFGRVAVEAMSLGIPVVSSNKGGLEEIVSDSGIVVQDLYDIKKWCFYINKLLNDKLYYRKISKKVMLKSRQYNMDKQLNKFKKIIELNE